MTEFVAIRRRDAHAIKSLLQVLNEDLESLVDSHSIPPFAAPGTLEEAVSFYLYGEGLDSIQRWRLSRDLRIRRRSEALLIELNKSFGGAQ